MPTVILQPDALAGKDTHIKTGEQYNTAGPSPNMLVGRFADAIHRSLIQFNLSSIPTEADILSAKLDIEMYYSEINDPVQFRIHPVTSTWDELYVIWDTQPTIDQNVFTSAELTSPKVYSIELKDLVKYSLLNGNYGYLIKAVDENRLYTTKGFITSDFSDATRRPKLTVVYNVPPTVPTLISPNGGELVDKEHLITWSPSTDVETQQTNLRYQIQLSTNDGATWKDIVSLTNSGETSLSYNFTNEVDSPVAKLRVRSFDGTSYSGWDESDGVFTIQHNIAPTMPTNLVPNGTIVDRTKTNRFSWSHNDSPNDVQSKAEIRWRTVGSTLWNNNTSNGPDREYYFANNVLPNGQIEWQVQTYDAAGLSSPWSKIAVFTAAEPTNAPTIISPESPVTVARPIIQWTSASQASYQIVIENSLGETVWDTDEIVSAVKSRTAGVNLVNGGTYTIRVRVKDGSGLFSSFTSKTVSVSYTPPAKPVLQAFKSDAAIQLVITNPQPTGTQPIVTGNDIFKVIDGRWVRIATNVSATFTDYAVADGVEYTYFAVANGETGVYSHSDEVKQSVSFRGAYIHDPLDPEFTVTHYRYNGTGAESEYTPETALMKFVGRKRPVSQFGTYGEFAVNATLQATRDLTVMRRLREFVANRQPICYRDDNGHFLYGIIQTLPITREFSVETTNITIVEVDYDPEV